MESNSESSVACCNDEVDDGEICEDKKDITQQIVGRLRLCEEVVADATKETEELTFQKENTVDKNFSDLGCSYNSSNYLFLKKSSPAYKSHRNENENQGKLEEHILLGKSTVHKKFGLKQYFDNGNHTTEKSEKKLTVKQH